MMKEQICCLADNSMRPRFYASSHGDVVIDAQRDTETIKAGAEIRSRGGNAHCDLLLFQRKSPENAGERTMAALILTRAVPRARLRKSG